MRQMTRWVGAGLMSLAGMGCVAANFPGQPSAGDLGRDLKTEEMPRLARMQRPDEGPIMVAQATIPAQTSFPTQTMPPLSISAQGGVPSSGTINSQSPPSNSPTYNIAPPPPPNSLSPGVAKNAPPPSLPSSPPAASVGGINLPPPPPSIGPSGTQQASLKATRSGRVAVRAWVNGRPIFDDEVVL